MNQGIWWWKLKKKYEEREQEAQFCWRTFNEGMISWLNAKVSKLTSWELYSRRWGELRMRFLWVNGFKQQPYNLGELFSVGIGVNVFYNWYSGEQDGNWAFLFRTICRLVFHFIDKL